MPKVSGKLDGLPKGESAIVEILLPGIKEPVATTVATGPGGEFSHTLKTAFLQRQGKESAFYRIRDEAGLLVSTRGLFTPQLGNPPKIRIFPGAFRGAILGKRELIVTGQLTNCAGVPLPDYEINAYDVDLHHVEEDAVGDLLGTDTTDADGFYLIRYAYQGYRSYEHQPDSEPRLADIAVAVSRAGNRLHTSPIAYNSGETVGAGRVSRIDIQLPPEARACTTSEYRRLIDKLYPILKVANSSQRHPRAAHLTPAELNFASNELEEERPLLEDLKHAHSIRKLAGGQISPKYDSLSEQIYGVLRLGLPRAPEEWVGIDDWNDVLEQVWDLCCVALKPKAAASLPSALEFLAHRAWLLQEAAPGRSARLALFKTAVDTNDKALAYAKISLRSTNEASRIAWIAAATNPSFSSSQRQRLKRLPVYAAIADFYADVLRKIINEDEADLAALSLAEVASLLQTVATIPAPREDFIRGVHARIRRRFGGQSLAGWLGAGFSFGRPELQRAQAVLDLPGFDIQRAVLDDFIDQFSGTTDERRETLATLKSVQRLVRTGIPADNLEAALDAGYDSAGRIAGAAASTFIAGAQLPIREGLRIHARARQLNATAAAARLGYGAIRSIGGAATRRAGFKPIEFGDTSLSEAAFASIFGGGVLCDCPEWLSAIGPGAYLDSLLNFLGSQVPAATIEYQARCGDFLDLRINEANTNTALPHIDVVIERLEDEARTELGLPLPDWAKRQTTWTKEQLALSPEFPETETYVRFSDIRYPWALLGSPAHFEITELLGLLDVARSEVNRDVELEPTGTQLARDWTKAALALTTKEFVHLTTTPTVLEAFGTGTSGLRPVDKLIERLKPALGVGKQPQPGEAFKALFRVLTRAFVNFIPNPPNPGLRFRRGSADVDLADVGIHGCSPVGLTIPDLNADRARRLYQFLLLNTYLRWPVRQLGHALNRFASGGAIDEIALHRFAGVVVLARRLKLSVEDALLLCTPFDPAEEAGPFEGDQYTPSQLNRLFAPEQVTTAPDPGDPPPTVTVAAIATRAGVSGTFAAERLGQAAGATVPLDATNPALLEVARWGTVARGLPSWSARQLKSFETWSGIPAFATDDPSVTLTFLRAIEDFEKSGWQMRVAERALGPSRPERQGADVDWRLTESLVDLWTSATPTEQGLDLEGLRAQLLDEYPEATVAAVAGELATDPATQASAGPRRSKLRDLLDLTAADLGLAGLSVVRWTEEIGRATSLRRRGSIVTERLLEGTMYGGGAGGQPPTDLTTPVVNALAALDSASPAVVGPGGNAQWRNETLLLPGSSAPGAYSVQPFVLLRETGQSAIEVSVSTGAGNPPGATVQVTIGIVPATPAPAQPTTVPAGSARTIDGLEALRVAEGQAAGPRQLDLSFQTTSDVQVRLTLVHPSGARTSLDQTRWYPDEIGLNAVRSTSRQLHDGLKLVEHSGISAGGHAALLATGNAMPALPEDQLNDWVPGSFSAWAPYRAWSRLLQGLKDEQQRASVVLLALAARGEPLSLQRVVDLLDQQWGYTPKEIETTLRELLVPGQQYDASAPLPDSRLVSVATLLAARQRLERGRSTGVPAADLERWSVADPTLEDADALRAVCLARFGREKVRTAADALRVRKRDSLIAYLIAERSEFSNARDISAEYLMNVEMEPAAETSRVRVAFMAVLRLVRQAIEQKEDFQIQDPSVLRYWDRVMKTHPVWAGVRLLMMYPENQLYTRERSLRHLGDSEIFAKFENRLLQGRLTSVECREALEQYVEDLHEVGHLESVGIYHERAVQPSMVVSTDRVHMIGRTVNEPRSYFHRTFESGAYWTPWEKIELDIDSDHVLPVVHNGRLHLFWPLFEPKKQETKNVPDSDEKLALSDTFLSVRFAWTEYTSRGWRPKTISQGRWSTRFAYGDAAKETHLPFFSVYNEVRRILQASQNRSQISLRPTWNAAGDLVVEVYAKVEAVEHVKSVYRFSENFKELLKALSQLNNVSGTLSTKTTSDAKKRRTKERLEVRKSITSAKSSLGSTAVPGFSAVSGTGDSIRLTQTEVLCAEARLGPDRSVTITSRPQLPAARRNQELLGLDRAQVLNNGLRERIRFPVGLALDLDGGDKLVLANTREKAVVSVCRQEQKPTKQHPVVCQVGGRSFFAMKEGLPAPIAGETLNFAKQSSAPTFKNEIPKYPILEVPVELALRLKVPPLEAELGSSLQSRAVAIATAAEAKKLFVQPVPAVEPRWRFVRNYHSFSYEFLRRIRASASALFDADAQNVPLEAIPSPEPRLRFSDYSPQPSTLVDADPEDGIEFDFGQPFAIYNWELFHHAPLMIASQLTRNGRYAEARGWLKVVFDPDDPAAKTEPHLAWKFPPFRRAAEQAAAGLLEALADPDASRPWQQRTLNGLVTRWRNNPYDPHAIASFRVDSYQRAVFFQYVENLLDWGDSLFVIPNPDSIDEAADYYAAASDLLGEAPESLGPLDRGDNTKTLDDVLRRESSWGHENLVATDVGEAPALPDEFAQEFNLDYFCMPPNPKVAELRARTNDRLFKVYNVLDLEGRPRRLPLFLPPVDPALLAAAGAAGLSIGAILADALAPRPHYRFEYLLDVAERYTGYVQDLGGSLLAAMEKRDGAALEALRAQHEVAIAERTAESRKLSVDEAKLNLEAVERSVETVKLRKEYYEKREYMNTEEKAALGLAIVSTILRTTAGALNFAAGIAGIAPDFQLGGAGVAASPVSLVKTGGENFVRVLQGIAQGISVVSQLTGDIGNIVGTAGGYRRRQEDWDFQIETAKSELSQFEKQVAAAELRVALAEHELTTQETRTEQSRDVLDFVRGKPTGEELYSWMVDQLRTLHRSAFELAVRMARQAEKAMQFELATDRRLIGFGQWNALRDGLLSGQVLRGELSALREHYIANNRRQGAEELTISLAKLSPLQLATLKTTGACMFTLDEGLFDAMAPGRYLRRIHRVSIEVKGVTGTSAGVHGTLTLLRSEYRSNASDPDNYPRGEQDPRFVDLFAPRDSIMISTGRGDTGVPTEQANDARYMPFEGAGAISNWSLEIPQEDNAFPVHRIADVELKVWVTSRYGGDALRAAAREADATKAAREEVSLISLEAQFPAEWQEYRNTGAPLVLDMVPWLPGGEVVSVVVFARGADTMSPSLTGSGWTAPPTGEAGEVAVPSEGAVQYTQLAPNASPASTGPESWTLDLGAADLDSVMLLVRTT
jgi:hypothetical protein